jgi:aspartyl-tRNA synthetase
MKWKNRIYCGELNPSHAGQDVLLMGWVDAIRDHGNLLFIHLRDVRGIVQVVFDPQVSPDGYRKAAALKEEYVVEVTGEVALRDAGTENPYLKTGEVEVLAHQLKVLSRSKTLPFQISEKAMVFGEDIKVGPEHVDEELRLQYRYLDLRRPSMQDLLLKRCEIMRCIRDYLGQMNFIEVETPFLTRSTPEGARDYLVPSRIHEDKFYSLPQSPQLFKQLLMISGMDRYYQIVRCFRDEDLRPNRQPEFTQLDLEASFIDEEFIYDVVEELTVRMFALGSIHLSRPFPRMTYSEAMARYGTDRPDLRFDMPFEDVTDILQNTGYGVFQKVMAQGGYVKGFCVKGRASVLSKNVLQNEYAMRIAPSFGAKGMTWMKIISGRLESNIVQFFSRTEQDSLRERFNAHDGDVLIMVADTSLDQVNKVLSSLRLHLADRLALISPDRYCPLWVTDFPLFELKDGKLTSQHHPFTMPDRTDFDPKDTEDLLSLHSRAYDLVINGEELGGGSIRIHDMETQRKVFLALNLTQDALENKFGFFLKALDYGVPPHGGLALGMDRVVAMILKVPSIREVIAFPKNRSAFCPLTQAPSFVEKTQLEELGLLKPVLDMRFEVPSTKPAKAELPAAERPVSERISISHVKHIAKLARLKLSDSEADTYQKDLNSILDYVETLREIDTQNVRPMSHVLKLSNIWREDKPGNPKRTDSILSNAPEREGDYFKVPKIIEG